MSAPEGFYYCAWQRIVCNDVETGENVSKNVALALIRDAYKEGDAEVETPIVSHLGTCFFILSGESFTLLDFGAAVSDALGIEVEIVDET